MERCSRRARRRAWRARCSAPGQLGIERAYVAGLLEVDDLDAALDLLADWQPPPLHRSIRARLALAALCACGRRCRPPSRRPSCARAAGDTARLVARALCAITTTSRTRSSRCSSPRPTAMNIERVAQRPRRARTLEEAQRAKLELVCDTLALGPGKRVLRRLRLASEPHTAERLSGALR
jgi:hypothetical protein